MIVFMIVFMILFMILFMIVFIIVFMIVFMIFPGAVNSSSSVVATTTIGEMETGTSGLERSVGVGSVHRSPGNRSDTRQNGRSVVDDTRNTSRINYFV